MFSASSLGKEEKIRKRNWRSVRNGSRDEKRVLWARRGGAQFNTRKGRPGIGRRKTDRRGKNGKRGVILKKKLSLGVAGGVPGWKDGKSERGER